MRYWLIAIWKTIPRSWIIISAPVVTPLFLFALWWAFGGFLLAPVDPHQKEYKAELAALLPRTKAGERDAEYRAGVIYRDGLAGKADITEAARLFEAGAKQGDVLSEVALGDLYERGVGVRQNYTRAVELYRSAVRGGGNPQAEFALGQSYFNGRGISQDYNAAVDWFRKAALGGHPGAQSVIGSMYAQGFGVDRDPVEAYVWYALASEHAAAAMSYRSDLDPRAALAKLKPTLSRLDTRNAERHLAEMRRKIAAGG